MIELRALNKVLFVGRWLLIILCPLTFSQCKTTNTRMAKIKQLTSTSLGHTIHHNHVFSKDDAWIVFDGRNDDTKIGETAEIGIVHVESGEERIIYRTHNPSIYGPGVGAASFAPKQDRVVFIKGLDNADKQSPYAMSRRTGYAIDIVRPMLGIEMDARDMEAPYSPGSLRGGTHSHCWNSDGSMLSFTYNDELQDADLRVVGVMFPFPKGLPEDELAAKRKGSQYASIVTAVVRDPTPGSDQINKAFDECWLGNKNSIAFQGNTLDNSGKMVTEIFLVDIDKDLILKDTVAVGREGKRPAVPEGIRQRRLTKSLHGLSDFRHWLRASPDGAFIYALGKDVQGRNQLLRCLVSTGELMLISDFDFSIASPINISYKGDLLTFIAQNNVFVFNVKTAELQQLTDFTAADEPLVGAPVFSRSDNKIAFNQFVVHNGNRNVQIKLIYL